MKKNELSFWEIWNMSFGFLGIQFGFALQGGFMSSIFQSLGAAKDDIPMPWIAAPLTGLLVQPVIGYMSDKTLVEYRTFLRRRLRPPLGDRFDRRGPRLQARCVRTTGRLPCGECGRCLPRARLCTCARR